MNTSNLYLARFSFSTRNESEIDIVCFSYCIEASNYKLAYQKALIIASEKFEELNQNQIYSFNKLEELSPLDSIDPKSIIENSIVIPQFDELIFDMI